MTSSAPVYTDPNATVAWSGNLTPDLVTDINLKTLIGRVQFDAAGDDIAQGDVADTCPGDSTRKARPR